MSAYRSRPEAFPFPPGPKAARGVALAVLTAAGALAPPPLAFAQQPAGVQPVKPDQIANAPAVTDPPATLAAPIERLIADLASPMYEVRQQAAAALAQRQDVSLADLEDVLTRPDLTAEQRVRLQALARERFATTPRGAMGVRFGGVLQQSRIVIDATYEGFNAHDVLRPGDVIVEAEGRSLRGDMARHILRAMVFAHDPGDTLDIVVRRGEAKLDLTLRLGSFHVLAQQPQGRPLDDLDLARAWAMRTALQADAQLARANANGGADVGPLHAAPVGGAVEPIATSLPADQWPTTRHLFEARYKTASTRQHGGKGQVAVAAGGQFREGGAGANTADPGFPYAMTQPTHPLEVLTRQPTIMPRERELTILAAMEVRTGEELHRLTTMLDTPDIRRLPGDQRAQTEELVRQYRQRLEMIRLERQAIEAEAAELGDEELDGHAVGREALLEQ